MFEWVRITWVGEEGCVNMATKKKCMKILILLKSSNKTFLKFFQHYFWRFSRFLTIYIGFSANVRKNDIFGILKESSKHNLISPHGWRNFKSYRSLEWLKMQPDSPQWLKKFWNYRSLEWPENNLTRPPWNFLVSFPLKF